MKMHAPGLQMVFTLLLFGILCPNVYANRGCNYKFAKEKQGILKFSASNYESLPNSNSSRCSWTIEMAVGHTIAIIVKELQLDVNGSLVISEIFKRQSTAQVSDRSFFVLKPGSVIFSQTNAIKIEIFTSNSSRAVFDAIFEDAECGGPLMEPKGEIEIPLSVHLSSSVRVCKWKLAAPKEKIIKVSFSQFSLPPGSCLFQSLTLKDDSQEDGIILGDFCEENPPVGSIISPTNFLEIEFSKRPGFISNLLAQVPRVAIMYEFIDKCNCKVSGLFGSLSVPLTYETFSTTTTDCEWEVEVPIAHHIALSFLKYANGPTIPGQSQELSIYEVFGINNTRLLWSSSDEAFPPYRIISETNNLRIVRRTTRNSYKSNGISFHAVYQAHVNTDAWPEECINIGSKRLFKCPNGHFIDCSWKCDGIADCEDGTDEAQCSDDDNEGFSLFDQTNEISFDTIGGTLLVAFLCGSTLIICLFVLSLDTVLQQYIKGTTKVPTEGRQPLHKLPLCKEVELKHRDHSSFPDELLQMNEVLFKSAKKSSKQNEVENQCDDMGKCKTNVTGNPCA